MPTLRERRERMIASKRAAVPLAHLAREFIARKEAKAATTESARNWRKRLAPFVGSLGRPAHGRSRLPRKAGNRLYRAYAPYLEIPQRTLAARFGRLTVNDLTPANLRAFRASLEPLAPTTRNLILYYVRGFLRWAGAPEFCAAALRRYPTSPKRV
jgi:hypothetical protein